MLLQLKFPKLACAACVNTVTQAIGSVDATAKVEADVKTKTIVIETQRSEPEIKAANAQSARFANAAVGYPAA